jgi:hypothetical protein
LLKEKNKPLRVAINGIEGTGETTFAKGFCTYLQETAQEACQPQEKADWIIDVNDFRNYKVLKNGK